MCALKPEDADQQGQTALVQFRSSDSQKTGPSLDVPLCSTPLQLTRLLNNLLNNEDPLPFAFFLTDSHTEITISLQHVMQAVSISRERIISITYQPQSLFHVRNITRCTSSLPGHTEAILTASFSPDCNFIATGSGDTNVRLWNPDSQIPDKILEGHKNWVLVVSFSPNATRLASASMDASVRVWDPSSGTLIGKPLIGHKKWITALAWQPFHVSVDCTGLVSASKDNCLRIWNTTTSKSIKTLVGHTASVTCVRWSGENVVYSASQDRTIKVWNPSSGLPLRTISAHGHWVNALALSTDYILRCGAFPTLDDKTRYVNNTLSQSEAKNRYEATKGTRSGGRERMVSGSDDFTLLLWDGLSEDDKERRVIPLARMTGHQQLVNDVLFSPDGLYIASASFDKSVRVWNGTTGQFLFTLRGHIGAVYRVVWSADSRMLLSASRDSTCKVWEIRTRKVKSDLPGHSDEVYTVDWSPDGKRAVSAGKDKMVKIWHH